MRCGAMDWGSSDRADGTAQCDGSDQSSAMVSESLRIAARLSRRPPIPSLMVCACGAATRTATKRTSHRSASQRRSVRCSGRWNPVAVGIRGHSVVWGS